METVTVTLGEQSQGHEEGLSRINYKSDFPLAVKLVKNGQPVAFPDCDFSIAAKTENGFTVYKAERKNGVCKHCKQDGDRLIMFFDNHGLGKGRIEVECVIDNPDADYTEDGIRQETYKAKAPIVLVDDNGDALDLRLPEPRVVEKVVEKIVEKEVQLPSDMKAFTEATAKAMKTHPESDSMGLFNSESEVLNALAAEELTNLPTDVLQNNRLANEVSTVLDTSNAIPIEVPLIKQVGLISLSRNYANSRGIGVPLNCQMLFGGIYLNNLSLTLRSPMDIRSMFMMSHIARLDIYLTDEFEIAKDMDVAVNSDSSHEDWVNYRNSDDSDELTSYEYGGYIKLLHLKFDPNKMEHAITLIRNLGRGCVKQIYLEPTGEIDTEQFARRLLEAIKPYTAKEEAIKDRIDDEYLCALSPIGQVWGAFGLGFPGASDGFRSKGYII